MDSEKKLRVFIGSSVESLKIAYAIQDNLEHQVEPTVWSQGVFEPSKYTLEALSEILNDIDFGIFVLGADDIIKLREQEVQATRDNVIFELGMFIGKLGKDRIFIVIPRGVKDFHLPTDLLGLTPAQFDPNRSDGNLVAALGPTCNKVWTTMQKLGSVRVNTTQHPNENSTQDANLPDEVGLSILTCIAKHFDRGTRIVGKHAIAKELGLSNNEAEYQFAKLRNSQYLALAARRSAASNFDFNCALTDKGRELLVSKKLI